MMSKHANSIQPAGISYKPPKAIGAFVWDELEMFAGTGGKSSPEACATARYNAAVNRGER